MADLVPGGQRARVFLFDASGVRVVGTWDAPWFVAKDVCTALGLGGDRVSEAVSSLDDDEKGSGIIATLGGPQQMLTVSESGLYALIFRSRKEQARVFRKWVTSEVLPQIRRTGGYVPRGAVAPVPAGHAFPPAALRLGDAIDEQLPALLVAALGGRAAVTVDVSDIARAALAAGLFAWMFAGPVAVWREHVALGRIIALRSGYVWPAPDGGGLILRSLGRNRHRRYLIQRQTTEGQA